MHRIIVISVVIYYILALNLSNVSKYHNFNLCVIRRSFSRWLNNDDEPVDRVTEKQVQELPSSK